VPCKPCDKYAVGAWYHNEKWGGLFTGMIDELKLYDYVRGDEEIAADAAR